MSPDSRRVLVLAYYFPPMGLSGVQRITKFVKYLPENGWDVTVVTPEAGGYFAFDESLLEDVTRPGVSIVRTKSVDPTRFFGKKRPVAFPSEGKRGYWTKLSQLVFVPDNKIGWFRYAVRDSLRELGLRRHDLIFSSAPPYTAHLAGSRVSQISGLPLIVDYRDDWIDNPRHVYPTWLHRRKHRRLEQRVLRQSSRVVTINRVIAENIERRLDPALPRVQVIPQGYDPDDLSYDVEAGKRCVFLYSGMFYGAQRPAIFLEGLAKFVAGFPEARKTVQARFVGIMPDDFVEHVGRLSLRDVVDVRGYLSHRDACRELATADVLWMTIGRQPGADQISTGKLFEYIGSRKPILALVPEGAAQQVLEKYSAATIVDPDDADATATAISHLHSLWMQKRLPRATADEVVEYDRTFLTSRLAGVFDEVVGG
jgi:glycosyltransferase involved in cell wall biosynthesis